MAVFLLKHLVNAQQPLRIVIFDRYEEGGTGMPYRQDMSPDYMLANIFSREIPVIVDTLADWLRAQAAEMLARWDVSPKAVSARSFYPRTLLGAFLSSQMQALVSQGSLAGHEIELRTQINVTDIRPEKISFVVVADTAYGRMEEEFDNIVLATGHTWDVKPKLEEASLVSPWPAANIGALPAGPIGILGSSLSAVDVAVALAHEHGRFDAVGDHLGWVAKDGHEALRITMVSKTGLLPEADFFYAFPYEPLTHLTEDALALMVADGQERILQRTFDLLMQEIRDCDPAYLVELGIGEPTIESFGTAYFARRQRLGAFNALRLNLAESRATVLREETIAWRYALLRGHEVFEVALPHLSEEEWETFRTSLLPVFADCYAAVPHLSLERLEALHAAGVLDIVQLGQDAKFLQAPLQGVVVKDGEDIHSFSVMVDARGQAAALPEELAFPSLVAGMVDPARPVEKPFLLELRANLKRGVYCLSMPQLLVRYPFSQGLPNCDALSECVARALVESTRPVGTAQNVVPPTLPPGNVA